MSTCHITSPEARRLLATLVLADGRWVSTGRLKVFCEVSYPHVVVATLKSHHGAAIESRPGGWWGGGGYRLLALPPDCCLDRVLDAIHELRRDAFLQAWRLAS